jgi:hypothetical protein
MPNKLLLQDWICRIKSDDATVFEDAYLGTRPSGPDVIPRLIEELKVSVDSFTRGKFCELLGEMGDESVLPVLQNEIDHPGRGTYDWANNAINMLQSSERRATHQEHLRHFRIDDGFED